MSATATITEFLKWVLIEGVGHGFIHFVAWFLLLTVLCRLPRLVWVEITNKRAAPKKAPRTASWPSSSTTP
jgi:hypothetical protein